MLLMLSESCWCGFEKEGIAELGAESASSVQLMC